MAATPKPIRKSMKGSELKTKKTLEKHFPKVQAKRIAKEHKAAVKKKAVVFKEMGGKRVGH